MGLSHIAGDRQTLSDRVRELNRSGFAHVDGPFRTRRQISRLLTIDGDDPQTEEKMFPVLQFRFADKFGKLSAGAKRRNSKQNYRRRGGACSRTIWADLCANRFVCRRSMVWTLQRTQRRMVGQRAIQLRVVRSVLRALSFLASVGRPARTRGPSSEVRTQK